MSKIGIDMGHPLKCGAFGFMSETDGNRAIGKLVISKLQSLGHTVINCTYDVNENELYNRVRLANAQPLDFFLSIHMDCYDNANANGVTIYTTENSSAKPMAINIINEVANSCGYYNRGWKSANFYVLKNTSCPAALVECGFVSSQQDCNKFNAEKIANSIIKAITGQTASSTTQPRQYNSDYIKSVQHDLQRVSCLATGEVNATGVLDAKTKAAIKQFRYIVDLPRSSESLDDNLVSALNKITSKTNIGVGWTANAIATKFIQWFIGISPKSGVFDANTVQKVKEWQKKEGIWGNPDGVIREKDWNKILK